MISIIIPVYNTSDYLHDCLRSVSAQSYSDWECILVDDGSTDGSGKICDDAAAADSRFKVVHQENSGVSSARNRGLEEATGDYICFIDSDDTVDEDYVGALFDSLVSSKAEMSVCGIRFRKTDGSEKILMPKKGRLCRMEPVDETKFVWMESRNLLFGPCQKMYLRDIVKRYGLHFETGIQYGEDLMFNLSYYDHISCYVTIPRCLYNYDRRAASLSSQYRDNQFHTDYSQWKALYAFHTRKGFTGTASQTYLYKRLWGILYNGLLGAGKDCRSNPAYIKDILAIPEIDDLKRHKDIFHCSGWIKNGILHRRAKLFTMLFKLSVTK